MSLFERGAASPSVSLAQLLAGGRPDIGGETDAALDHYAREIAASGFPGMRLADPAARPDRLDGYLDRATDHDLPLMGHRARRPGIVRRWLSAYAAATSTTATYETIRDAATGGESAKPAKSTTTVYRDLLGAMRLVDPLPAWWPLGNPLSRLKRGQGAGRVRRRRCWCPRSWPGTGPGASSSARRGPAPPPQRSARCARPAEPGPSAAPPG